MLGKMNCRLSIIRDIELIYHLRPGNVLYDPDPLDIFLEVIICTNVFLELTGWTQSLLCVTLTIEGRP